MYFLCSFFSSFLFLVTFSCFFVFISDDFVVSRLSISVSQEKEVMDSLLSKSIFHSLNFFNYIVTLSYLLLIDQATGPSTVCTTPTTAFSPRQKKQVAHGLRFTSTILTMPWSLSRIPWQIWTTIIRSVSSRALWVSESFLSSFECS